MIDKLRQLASDNFAAHAGGVGGFGLGRFHPVIVSCRGNKCPRSPSILSATERCTVVCGVEMSRPRPHRAHLPSRLPSSRQTKVRSAVTATAGIVAPPIWISVPRTDARCGAAIEPDGGADSAARAGGKANREIAKRTRHVHAANSTGSSGNAALLRTPRSARTRTLPQGGGQFIAQWRPMGVRH